jgi:hypothetical protein
MPEHYGVDLRGIFQEAVGELLPPATLKRRTHAGYDAADPSGGPNHSESAYACRATVEVSETYQAGDQVRVKSGRATILLGGLPMNIRPRAGDRLRFVVPGSTQEDEAEIVGDADFDGADVQATVQLSAISGP